MSQIPIKLLKISIDDTPPKRMPKTEHEFSYEELAKLLAITKDEEPSEPFCGFDFAWHRNIENAIIEKAKGKYVWGKYTFKKAYLKALNTSEETNRQNG